MKNKKNLYILLPIVLLIWGAVMYQFFSFSTIEELQTDTSNEFVLKHIAIKERDTVAINVNYRDPFLGKMYSEKINGTVAKKKSKYLKKIPDKPNGNAGFNRALTFSLYYISRVLLLTA